MEEQEPPIEHLHEELHHHAEHANERWIPGVALSAAILAALAAVASLLSGHYANESMLEQLRASDKWSYYQAKSIKEGILVSKMETLKAIGKDNSEADGEKLKRYREEQADIQKKANALEDESSAHLSQHLVLARGVTLFQIAITVAAISVLTKQRRFWFVGLAFGAAGLVFLIYGALIAGHVEHPGHPAAEPPAVIAK